MNNKDFIAELSQRTGLSPEESQRYVNFVTESMGDHFQEGDTVLIPSFGTFSMLLPKPQRQSPSALLPGGCSPIFEFLMQIKS